MSKYAVYNGYIVEYIGKPIATTTPRKLGTDTTFDEARAIAQRIAATLNACHGLNPEAVSDLLEAAKDFVAKVGRGDARSTDSYAKFKAAIQKATP